MNNLVQILKYLISFPEQPSGSFIVLAKKRAFFVFAFFKKFFYRNIFLDSGFTVLYPCRPAGGRQRVYRPAGGR